MESLEIDSVSGKRYKLICVLCPLNTQVSMHIHTVGSVVDGLSIGSHELMPSRGGSRISKKVANVY